MRAILLVVGLVIALLPLGATAGPVDYSGYWRITRDSGPDGAQGKVVSVERSGSRWSAEFFREEICSETGNPHTTFLRAALQPKVIGTALRCATKAFVDKCPGIVDPDPYTSDFENKDPYDAKLEITKVKKNLIKGSYWMSGYRAPSDGSKCVVDDDYDKKHSFKLERMSCPGGGSPQSEEDVQAYKEWMSGQVDDLADTLSGGQGATIVGGYERSVAAGCLPTEVINSFRKCQAVGTFQDCQASCLATSGWFREVAAEASQAIPLNNFETTCSARLDPNPSPRSK